MKKEDLKKIIFEEAVYIKNLIEEKKNIEKELKKLENDYCDESEIEETTGKGQAVNNRASHKGEIGKKLRKEEEKIKEIIGVSQTSSHQASKNTTNPVYKSRNKKNHISEEQLLRILIKNYLFEDIIKKSVDMKNFRVTVKHDEGKITFSVKASNEDDAKEMVMKAEGCPKSAIISVKEKR